MRKSDYTVATLLALVSFVVYLLTLAPDMLPGDSGEFQFASPRLSIVHPTGYPLYLLLAKLFTFIPIGSVAFRVNLVSAIWSALAVGTFYIVALRLLSDDRCTTRDEPANQLTNQLSALIASLTLAFSRTFWSQATEAEVYALNSLFVIALIGLSLAVKRQEGRGAAWLWLSLVSGLALTHHRSILLLLPALVIYLYPFARLRRVWPLALPLLLLPLMLYLYTPLRYDATPYAQIALDEQHVITTLSNSPSAFVAHALGAGFGGALRWDAQSIERLLVTPERVTANLTLLGCVLVSLGMLWLLWRREWRLAALFITLSLTYFVFNAAYQIGDIGDFYTPVYVAGAWLAAYGVAAIGRWHLTLAVLSLALPPVLFISNFAPMREGADFSVRTRWQQLLAQNPPSGAILISNDRDEMTPLYYLQLVDSVRPDLVGLFPLISTESHMTHVVPLTQYALETSRPVYFIKPLDGLSLKFRMQPEGQLVRVLSLQETRPESALVRESPLLKFIGWSQGANWHPEPASPAGSNARVEGRKSQLEVVLFWQTQGANRPNVKTYVHVVGLDGKTVAQDDHTPGGMFYPPSQWAAGEILYDSHVVILPPNILRGEYQLVAGAYPPNGGTLDGVARIELGTVRVGE